MLTVEEKIRRTVKTYIEPLKQVARAYVQAGSPPMSAEFINRIWCNMYSYWREELIQRDEFYLLTAIAETFLLKKVVENLRRMSDYVEDYRYAIEEIIREIKGDENLMALMNRYIEIEIERVLFELWRDMVNIVNFIRIQGHVGEYKSYHQLGDLIDVMEELIKKYGIKLPRVRGLRDNLMDFRHGFLYPEHFFTALYKLSQGRDFKKYISSSYSIMKELPELPRDYHNHSSVGRFLRFAEIVFGPMVDEIISEKNRAVERAYEEYFHIARLMNDVFDIKEPESWFNDILSLKEGPRKFKEFVETYTAGVDYVGIGYHETDYLPRCFAMRIDDNRETFPEDSPLILATPIYNVIREMRAYLFNVGGLYIVDSGLAYRIRQVLSERINYDDFKEWLVRKGKSSTGVLSKCGNDCFKVKNTIPVNVFKNNLSYGTLEKLYRAMNYGVPITMEDIEEIKNAHEKRYFDAYIFRDDMGHEISYMDQREEFDARLKDADMVVLNFELRIRENVPLVVVLFREGENVWRPVYLEVQVYNIINLVKDYVKVRMKELTAEAVRSYESEKSAGAEQDMEVEM